jgi:HD-like signal output (HDOD) protein
MPNISIEHLEAGMKLADDVLNPRGQVLIPSGTAIQPKHLKGLNAWGVKSVSVTMSSVPESLIEASGIKLMSEDEIDEYLNEFFCFNKDIASNELIAVLRDIAHQRLAQKGLTEAVERSKASLLAEPSVSIDRKPSITIDDLINMTSNIATLPNIYFELQNVMARPSSASADMANAIRNDPGLTARLLRIVNSAYYSFPTKIETVPRAITIVGTDELTSLVTATSVLKTFGSGLDNVFDMNTFWKHSIAAGIIARILGAKRHEQNEERFFVMGLLHDIGRVLMFSHIPKYMKAALGRATREQIPLVQVESDDIGFNHAAVGAALARSWRMAAGQQEAISYHHRPDFALRYKVEAGITHIADILSHVVCVGQCPNGVVPPVELAAWERLDLDVQLVPKIVGEADQNIDELVDIFFSE